MIIFLIALLFAYLIFLISRQIFHSPIRLLMGTVIGWLYWAVMESSVWQATLGKRALGIKVVDLYGRRIGFGRATGRYFGKIVSAWIFCVGLMMAGWTQRKQGLHDKMAGTLVVFNAVQPGQPLPTQRPPMPWYGWAINILHLLFLVICFIVGIIIGLEHQNSTANPQVAVELMEAVNATAPIRAEIARQGCQSGNRPSPSRWIETVVVENDNLGRCMITLWLAPPLKQLAAPNDSQIKLVRWKDGKWDCIFNLPAKYLRLRPPGRPASPTPPRPPMPARALAV